MGVEVVFSRVVLGLGYIVLRELFGCRVGFVFLFSCDIGILIFIFLGSLGFILTIYVIVFNFFLGG